MSAALRSLQLFLFLGLAMLLVGCVPPGARGGPDARVAVLPMKGKRARAIDKTLHRAVSKRYELVSGKRYEKAARRLRARTTRPEHVREVARKLGLDAVVESELLKRGKRRYELRIRLFAGRTGEEIERFRFRLKRRRLSAKKHRRLRHKLVGALAEVRPSPAGKSGESEERTRARRSRGDSERTRRERERARRLRKKKHQEQLRREAQRLEDKEREERRRKTRRRRRRERMAQAEEEEERREERRRRSRREERAKRSRSSERDPRRRRSRRRERAKEERAYPVVTERDEETGQAIDEENPL